METKASENIIELKGIRKIYEDNFEAVKDFNLQVKLRQDNYVAYDCRL